MQISSSSFVEFLPREQNIHMYIFLYLLWSDVLQFMAPILFSHSKITVLGFWGMPVYLLGTQLLLRWLTLKALHLVKFSADDILIYFYYFPKKSGFNIPCELSPLEKICIKLQILFYGEKKKEKLETPERGWMPPLLPIWLFMPKFLSKSRVCNSSNNNLIGVLWPLCTCPVYILTLLQISSYYLWKL